MKISFICAMEEEVVALLKQLKEPKDIVVGPVTIHSGKINDHEVSIIQCGIGKVQAAMATSVLLTTQKPDAVINTGSAGGIGSGLAIGDIVVSNGVAYYDVDVSASGGYPLGQLPGQPRIFEASEKIAKQIQQASHDVDLKAHVGLIVSGDEFINSKQKIDEIKAMYPEALAVEMEGAAIGQVCYQFKIPFVVVRAMSDVGDSDSGVDFDKFIVEAGQKSAQMGLAFLNNLD